MIQPYSFLRGILDAGYELRSFCEEEGFTETYDNLPSFLFISGKRKADDYLIKGLAELFRTIAHQLMPDISTKEFYSSFNHGLKNLLINNSIISTLKSKHGLEIIDTALHIGKELIRAYDEVELDNSSYIQGMACLKQVLITVTEQIPGYLKRVVPDLTGLLEEAKRLIK